jgi:hypothetical protein
MNKIGNIEDRLKQKNEGVILLDYEFPSAYPDFIERRIFPKPEVGLVKGFEISKMEQWSHENCMTGKVSTEMIFNYLQFNGLLDDCIGYPELGGIYEKGPEHFEKHFPGKAVFAWQATVDLPRGRCVPYLTIAYGILAVCYKWMIALCEPGFVSLRHTEHSRIYSVLDEQNSVDNGNIIAFPRKAR